MSLFEESGMKTEPRKKKSEASSEDPAKKHTIKSRTRATTSFALRQVRDAIVAGGVITAFQNFIISSSGASTFGVGAVTGTAAATPVVPAIGLLAIGVGSFLASKGIFKLSEKHIIKHREKGNLTMGDGVKEAIAIALPMTTLMIGGFGPAAVVSIGVGMITLTRALTAQKRKERKEEKARKKEEKRAARRR